VVEIFPMFCQLVSGKTGYCDTSCESFGWLERVMQGQNKEMYSTIYYQSQLVNVEDGTWVNNYSIHSEWFSNSPKAAASC
jgi:hypothetical protein